MFTPEDHKHLMTTPTPEMFPYSAQKGGVRWEGGSAAWLDTDGNCHYVAMHEHLMIDGEVVGYRMRERGWIRLWTSHRDGDCSEFGFEAKHRLPNDQQTEYMIAAAQALSPKTTYGILCDKNISHSAEATGTPTVEHLKKVLPHS